MIPAWASRSASSCRPSLGLSRLPRSLDAFDNLTGDRLNVDELSLERCRVCPAGQISEAVVSCVDAVMPEHDVGHRLGYRFMLLPAVNVLGIVVRYFVAESLRSH